MQKTYTIALAGNPNVGKSTIFNSLTGMHQHTGNWTGKTVANAIGESIIKNQKFKFVDLPGTYSLMSKTEEEEIAREYICSENADLTVVVVDGTVLERNLNLVYQIMDITNNVLVCVNLLDEAKKKKIDINLKKLEKLLGVPVVGTIARDKHTLNEFKNKIYKTCNGIIKPEPIKVKYKTEEKRVEDIINKAHEVVEKVCTFKDEKYNERDIKIDKILTSKKFGIPIMILFLALVFWITIVGANYPSQLLFSLFGWLQDKLIIFANYIHCPEWLSSMLIDGVYQTLTWVIAVMFPPMAIFFPLFTFLEDLGYLPRIAFNMDGFFKKACCSR